ncbi:uncharacterized protein [Choristoneura fumiferana]|uniref:uncharacterized protein n=1 Tax=Choristoneura fumiferana TaxID=7141 RepID=UPI003D15B878
MVINVGINGFGRIGRVIFRTCCQHPDIEVAAINDPAIELPYICYLIKFDSTHGKYKGNISYEDNVIKINDHSIMVFHQKAPCDIPWQKADVQYVIEASGMFTNMEKASGHLASDGVRRVLVTAPSSDVPMLILGVNQDRISSDVKVVSCTSSTLYCLAPIIKLLQDAFGVGEGFVTSIHAMTPSLKPLDGLCIRGKHWRDHRSIHQNIIPAATGACKALGRIIPAVRDKLAGLAFRVPIVNVSVLDLCIRLNKSTTIKEITECIEKVKDPILQDVIQVSKEQAVSSDFIGDSHSCTVDVDSSLQLRPNFFKLICWYENEFSYACRVVDTILHSERQYSLISTPITKMTYVRPIFWKTNHEQRDNKKHATVDSITKSSLSPCESCEVRSFSRPMHRPLSPYVSEASNLRNRSAIYDHTNTLRTFIDKFGKSSSVQDKITVSENSEVIKHIYHERVKAQERLDSVKQEFSRMVEITEDLLKKPSSKKYEPILENNSPSKEMTELKNSNTHPLVLTITSSAKEITASENLNNRSLEITVRPAEEITDKKNVNTKSPRMAIKCPSKGTTGNENSSDRLYASTIRNSRKGAIEEDNLKTSSLRTNTGNVSKLTTQKGNSNTDLSKRTTKKPSKELTDMDYLNNSSSKGKDNLKAHSSGITLRSPLTSFTGKEKINAHSSETRVDSHSRGINEKGCPNTNSSGLVTKSSPRGIAERGYSNVNVCTLPMRRPSKAIEKTISSSCLPSLTTRKSKDTTENENLHNYLSLNGNNSPLQEKTEVEEKSTKDHVRKSVTGNYENSNEVSEQIKYTNTSAISNKETESLNISLNEDSNKELPKVDSPIGNKAGNLAGLNVLRKIYQTCENNNIPFNSKNTNRSNNNISRENIQKPNHTKNKIQISNMVNKLEENLSSTSNVNSSIFDDNDDINENYNDQEVIHIVSEDPKRFITSSNLNVEVEKFTELLKQCNTNDSETVDPESVKVVTADLLNRRLSKIEIVDEKLKQRNIVLVEHVNEDTKFETNTNKDDMVPSHAGDYCETAYQNITRNEDEEEEEGSNSHDSIKIVSEMTSLCDSPVNTVTTVSNNDTYRSKQDIYDKLDSVSVSGSENSFQMLEKKSQIINITDLTYSLDDLARLDKICRIIEISDELSDKLFAPLDDRSDGGTSKHKWSFNDLCKRIKLDEFCNNVFGKTSM